MHIRTFYISFSPSCFMSISASKYIILPGFMPLLYIFLRYLAVFNTRRLEFSSPKFDLCLLNLQIGLPLSYPLQLPFFCSFPFIHFNLRNSNYGAICQQLCQPDSLSPALPVHSFCIQTSNKLPSFFAPMSALGIQMLNELFQPDRVTYSLQISSFTI